MTSSTQVLWDDATAVASSELPWSELDGRSVLVTGASGMLPSLAVRTLLEIGRAHV